MTAPRDLSAMYTLGGCVVCGGDAPNRAKWEAHVAAHLADGSAVVIKEFQRSLPVAPKPDRVVPTTSQPIKDTADDPNPKVTLPRSARSVYRKSYR